MSLGDHAHERHFPDSCLTSVRLRFLAIQKCWSWDPQRGSLPETQGGVRCSSRLHSQFSQRFCLYGGAVHTNQVTRGQRFPSNFVTKPSHAHPGSSSGNPRHRASYRPHSRCEKTFWESRYKCMKTRSILSSGDGRQRLLPRLWPENGDHLSDHILFWWLLFVQPHRAPGAPCEWFEGSETPQDVKYGISWEAGEPWLRARQSMSLTCSSFQVCAFWYSGHAYLYSDLKCLK